MGGWVGETLGQRVPRGPAFSQLSVERGNGRLFPQIVLSLHHSKHTLGQFDKPCLYCHPHPFFPSPFWSPYFPHIGDMVRKQLEGLWFGMERKLDSWLNHLSLSMRMYLVPGGSGSSKQDLSSPSPFPFEDWLICLSEESRRLRPQRRARAQDVPTSPLCIYKQQQRRAQNFCYFRKGGTKGLRDTKCQAGGQTLFKCFKM